MVQPTNEEILFLANQRGLELSEDGTQWVKKDDEDLQPLVVKVPTQFKLNSYVIGIIFIVLAGISFLYPLLFESCSSVNMHFGGCTPLGFIIALILFWLGILILGAGIFVDIVRWLCRRWKINIGSYVIGISFIVFAGISVLYSILFESCSSAGLGGCIPLGFIIALILFWLGILILGVGIFVDIVGWLYRRWKNKS